MVGWLVGWVWAGCIDRQRDLRESRLLCEKQVKLNRHKRVVLIL